MVELASATTEALAIWDDINGSIQANRSVSAGKLQLAKDAETAQKTALKALQVHTQIHREISN
jgi:hypothetical protein